MADDAQLAASFGAVADEYDRGRPGYPAEAIDHVAEAFGLDEASTVVDLAAGTGKLTRRLTGRFGRLVAVEPLPGMLARLSERSPEVEAFSGSAESIPLPSDIADAVLVAQAFHWFAGPAALAEIARVLRPRGGLGLIWNMSPWEEGAEGWFARVNETLETSRADLSTFHRHSSGEWMPAFEGDELFEALEYQGFEHTQRLSTTELMASFESRSYLATMAEAERAEILAAVQALLDEPDAPIENGEAVFPLVAHVFTTRLRS